jgi:YD repeat-containing protein
LLLKPSGDNVLLQHGENTQELFVNIGGGAYSSANNNTAATLTRSGAGTPADQFTLVSRGGVVSNWLGFHPSIATPGRMTRFQDRFGNTQTFTWAVIGCAAVRLQSLTDSYGRTVTFSYWDAVQNYAMRQVTDFLGRQVNLQYDSAGHLTAVIGPAITRGANNNANVFPGLGWAFKWDVSNPRPERRNDLLAIYHPNQVAPYLDSTRTVDVAAVYTKALALEHLAYFQDPTDGAQYGKVQQYTESATGTGTVGAGAYGYMYLTTDLPTNIANGADPIVSRTVVTDRMGNQTAHDIGASGMIAHKEVFATRNKNSLQASSWETWMAFNTHNQNTLTVFPERNSVVRTYEDETTVPVINGAPYAPRIGLPRTVTRLPGNTIGLTPVRAGSNGQTQLVETTFSDPLWGRPIAAIEVRGNSIDSSGDYFVPQNGGTTPTDADKSRYATITFLDYQKDSQDTVAADAALQAQLGLASADINTLINFVNSQMTATDGTGGIPAGFEMGLGPINGDGTGSGSSSGLPDATHIGNVVKIQHPTVRQLLTPAYTATVLSDGPLAYWRLGESGGTTATDSSGNGLSGAYDQPGVTLGEPGAIRNDPNASAAFNTVALEDAGYAGTVTTPAFGAALTNLTVEAWCYLGSGGGFFSHNPLDSSATDYFRFMVSPSGGSFYLGPSSASLPVLVAFSSRIGWHHFAVTWDGTTLSFYVDGLLAGAATGSNGYSPGDDIFCLGSSATAGYNGRLDEVAIYPTALSADRIHAHYNAGIGVDQWVWAEQQRVELFTNNLLGQNTTRTDAEGNVTVTVRYPQNDPEGAAQYLVPTLSNKQYGFVKEIHVDADPATVMTLLGSDADLAAFTGNVIARTNSAGVYLDLVTSYKPTGTGGSGCSSCAYDPLGNPLSVTDPRNHTTTYDRNELGEPYRVTSPAPYNYPVETYYDANRNVIQVDTQDVIVKYTTNDPGDPAYARFVPTGSGSTANLPTMPGPGGSVRPGWFSNLYSFDLLDNKIEEDIDATGSSPASLVTTMAYDFNQNMVKLTKPLTNTVEWDYDERNFKIAIRVGGPTGSVTIMAYDGNVNLTDVIGPATRGTPAQTLSAVIGDAFGGSSSVTFSGDWLAENVYDGFDRKISTTDPAGGMGLNSFDPGGRTVATQALGSPRGPTPTDRSGSANILLASSEARFDEAGRRYETQRDVFLDGGAYYLGIPGNLPSGRSVTHTGGGLAANSTTNNHTATVTLTAGGTSYVLERTVFDRADRVTAVANDNGAITTITLDGAGRQPLVVDALGNSVQTRSTGTAT